MARLGYSPRSLLETARRAQKVYDLGHLGGQDTCLMAAIKILEDKKKPPVAPEEVALNVDEELSCFPQVGVDWSVNDDQAAVRAKLKEKVGECRVAGCDDSYAIELGKLLVKYEDVFRLKLGRDPPVKVEPLRVTLKADAKPVRCKARRYSKEQREFMAKHVDELQAAGLCYRNPRSKWCSAPLIVKKPDANEFRMTVDVRPVNAQTERILWPMPMLEVILDHLCGAQVFFTRCSGAAQRWAIVEKEAFSIVECLKRADYLLHKPGGFALFTDHANLKFIFNPTSVNAAIPKYTAAKLDRWALLLMGYDYTIYDIAGGANVWADLLSRWGTNSPTICPIVHVPLKISPLRNEEFV
ncbi:hypothetical protein LEN26_012317 [Aphanomyces euteiches]|nr:hypothetical protein LEN26_012317 [Aphanomyces euteiches]